MTYNKYLIWFWTIYAVLLVIGGITTLVYWEKWIASHVLYYLILIVALIFVSNINMYMRGTQTEQTGNIIFLMQIALLIVPFFLFGWRVGFTIIFLNYIISKILLIPANRIASKMLGYRVAIQDTDAHRDMDEYNNRININSGYDYWESLHEKENKRNKQLTEPRMAKLLQQHNYTKEQVISEIDTLVINGFDANLADEIYKSSQKMSLFIKLKSENSGMPKTVFAEYLTQKLIL